MKLVYEGKAKKLFDDGQPDSLVMEFKDSLTAFNAKKKGSFEGKGQLNLLLSEKIFEHLKGVGVSHHLLEVLGAHRVRVKKLKMLPVEVVVRNWVAGSLSQRLGLSEGLALKAPLVEYYLKNDELGDPLLTEAQMEILEILPDSSRQKVDQLARKINLALREFFQNMGVTLVDFKIELGWDSAGVLTLADEITPDSCRLWDTKTLEKLDKDVFRRDLGDVGAAYRKIAERMGIKI